MTSDFVFLCFYNAQRLVVCDLACARALLRMHKIVGIIVQAPGEAEAQCAALVRAGKVFATGTEDMDALAFASPVLLRHLTMSEQRCAHNFPSGFCMHSLHWIPSIA